MSDTSATAATATDYEAMPDEKFRHMVRDWVVANCPPECLHPKIRLRRHEVEHWSKMLSEKGWIAPGWPTEHGGMGLTIGKQLIYHEEFERLGVARAPDQGIVMIGPLLINYGSGAQRERFLPSIVSCEHVWCQGYSEPNAGSDLASLRTEAVLEGDEYVVTGQKTWSTLAQDGDWMFTLVRTDPTVKKQRGISFLLIDMKSPGITVHPVENLGGDDEFCEVFLDRVRVPKENIVGKVNDGWSMAKALLGFERIFIGSPKMSLYALGRLKAVGEALGLSSDPVFRDRLAQLRLDVDDHEKTYARYAKDLVRGGTLGPEVSVLKIWGTETYQRIMEYLIELLDERGASEAEIDLPGGETFNALGLYYHSRCTSIYAGTNEIQRNILAKAVLRLPSG